MSDTTPQPASQTSLFFTAFEPSGDALAAPVIAQLLAESPDLKIHAVGGPKMREAGANMLELTTEKAAMHGDAIKQAWSHRQRVQRITAWLRENPIALHIPVDSPAANWAICKAVRKLNTNAKIAHLAAPQLWAWAPWRIRKLRRLTDHVLCLLPFEPAWFGERGVKASFVGHPLLEKINDNRDTDAWSTEALPDAPLKLALLPGSREGEVRRNAPTMLAALDQLRLKHASMETVIATPNDAITAQLAKLTSSRSHERTQLAVGTADKVLHWADVALVVSGTATLQTAGHLTPMVAMYNLSRMKWHTIGRWLVKTRTFTLPNLISEAAGHGRVIKEFVPHFAQVDPIVEALDELLSDESARTQQREALAEVVKPFDALSFTDEVTTHLRALL